MIICRTVRQVWIRTAKAIDIEPVYGVWPRILLAELLGRAHAIIVFLEMFPDRVDLHLLDRLVAKRQPRRPQIAAVDRLAGCFVERIAIALRPSAGNAYIEAVI